jgi:alpha-L-rhamnosidase
MDTPRIGHVQFKDGAQRAATILSQLEVITMNALYSNLVAYLPIDCPTREKRSWLGDSLNTVELAMMTLWTPTIHSFFLSTMIVDSQAMNPSAPNYGWIPPVVQWAQQKGKPADLSWTMAFPLISYHMLRYYNDTELVASLWPQLTLFMDSMTKAGRDEIGGLADFYVYGDWCTVEPRNISTPGTGPILAAANYLMSLKVMGILAEAIGETEDALKYTQLHAELTPVFHSRFWTPATKSYNHNDSLETQCLNSVALSAGVVPEEYIPSVQASLIQDVHDRNNQFTVGATGAMWLLQSLTNAGDLDGAIDLATQTKKPSWGWWLTQNATTCWENWSGVADATHPPNPTHNHIFLCGGIGSWMYQYLAGVRPLGFGYSVVEIAPETESKQGPDAVSVIVETIRGEVKVSWLARDAVTISSAALQLNVEVPYTARAVVRFPVDGLSVTINEEVTGMAVWKSGKFISGCPGVENGAVTDRNRVTLEVSSGKYSFIVH